ncbi:beta-lactamase superfamily II metal-dependent hydrolase [Inhella inkyongensis]|uniref:Beta-lactamase superfamily II metal-dependent hydrolase n=1 Tax=Inhella inkyongensis TaxID=392593 RepID=A0A840S9R3_9BURK|nr:MBL fold metallo-hydrolase [Inhella inkyongensis]MBB5206373.1 beta-lactamase superfamily II metal-dependent hydrolase [Inhella inkyongensis]
MEIRPLKARFGDSILVLWGRPKRALLIDGGVGKTYGESIQPAFAALREQGVQALEALVVTHLDRDHIGGVADVIRRRHQHQLGIRDVWFNGARHLPVGAPRPRSIAQAEALGAMLHEQGLAWNAAFSGGAIRTPSHGPLPRVELPGGLAVTVLSPNLPQLKRLAALWPQALAETSDAQPLPRARGASPKRPPASIPIDLVSLAKARFAEDSSVANGSSLALLLEHKGRAALMAGDAYPSVLAAAWRRLCRERGGAVGLDLLKLSHHGSSTNTSPQLLGLLKPKKLLITTDGSGYGHPHAETLAWALLQIPDVELIFNYSNEYSLPWETIRKGRCGPKVRLGAESGLSLRL